MLKRVLQYRVMPHVLRTKLMRPLPAMMIQADLNVSQQASSPLTHPYSGIAPSNIRHYVLNHSIEFDQGKLLNEANKNPDANLPMGGFCLGVAIKEGALQALGAKTKLEQGDPPNAEKSVAKFFGYMLATEVSDQRVKENPSQFHSREQIVNELVTIAHDFTDARSRKLTDAEKNIHLNSVEVGAPAITNLAAYIEEHGLEEDQALVVNFMYAARQGHSVCVIMRDGDKVKFLDPNDGLWDCSDPKPASVAADVEERLSKTYDWYDRALTDHFIFPITPIPKDERLPSQTIDSGQRKKIEEIIGPAWDAEIDTPAEETMMKTLIVERDQETQELLWAAFDMPNGKILKLGGAEIPRNLHDQITANEQIRMTPIPRSRALREVERAALPPEMQRLDVETSLPNDEVKLKVLFAKRDSKTQSLRSAVFQLENGKLLRLSRKEIPENLHQELTPEKSVALKPIIPENNAQKSSRITIPLENMLAHYKARALTKEEQSYVHRQIPSYQEPAAYVPVIPTKLQVMLATRDKDQKLESAIFRILGTQEVFKLRADEIPENIRDQVKKDQTIEFKPIPIFEKSQSKAKRLGR